MNMIHLIFIMNLILLISDLITSLNQWNQNLIEFIEGDYYQKKMI